MRVFSAKAFDGLGVVQAVHDLVVATSFVFTGAKYAHPVLAAVIHTVEKFAHADGPGEGHDGHAELAFNLVHHAHRVLYLAVHLVDKSQDGRASCAAHLQQAAGLRLNAVGRVNHHQRRINGGQHAVGVFRKILVAGRVEQVNNATPVFHLHDR